MRYVDKALEQQTDESVKDLLESVKRNFGTEATIGPPRPPGFSVRGSVRFGFCVSRTNESV